MRFILFFVSVVLVCGLSGLAVNAAPYRLDTKHMQVGFKVSHLVIATVNGQFKKFEGQFDFDEAKSVLSNLKAKIDIDSIDTNEDKRDRHLRGNDFFAIRKQDGKGALIKGRQFMQFTSKGGKIKKGTNKLKGRLKIGKHTRAVELLVDFKGAVQDPWGNKKLVFKATTKIKRQDFGLKWSKKLDNGGLVVGEMVEVIIEGEANAVKSSAKS